MELVTSTADQVRAQRERLGLTQTQLAERLGVHTRTITRWELGLFAPHPIWLIRLSNMQPDVKDAKMVTDG